MQLFNLSLRLLTHEDLKTCSSRICVAGAHEASGPQNPVALGGTFSDGAFRVPCPIPGQDRERLKRDARRCVGQKLGGAENQRNASNLDVPQSVSHWEWRYRV